MEMSDGDSQDYASDWSQNRDDLMEFTDDLSVSEVGIDQEMNKTSNNSIWSDVNVLYFNILDIFINPSKNGRTQKEIVIWMCLVVRPS